MTGWKIIVAQMVVFFEVDDGDDDDDVTILYIFCWCDADAVNDSMKWYMKVEHFSIFLGNDWEK